jgi:hypothetical protein
MNINHLRKTLEAMKGKTYECDGDIYLVQDFVPNDGKGRVILHTDQRSFEIDLDVAEKFLASFKPVRVAGEVEDSTLQTRNQDLAKTVAPPVQNAETNLVDELTAILKDNIAKVQKDAKYIPQAQAINNNVNSIINLTKLKLDVYKQFKNQKPQEQ